MTTHLCNHCDRSFSTKRGLNIHIKSCQKNNVEEAVPIEKNLSHRADKARYKWGEYNDTQVQDNINRVYEKIVYWRKNLFMLPTGKAGIQFIEEMTKLMLSWVEDTAMKDIAFTAIMIMPSLLLQKPSKRSKSKEHLIALERRIEFWKSGEFLELLKEEETIQKDLQDVIENKTLSEISRKFTTQMQKGNVNGAIKILTNNMQNGILPLNKETLNNLKLKHPKAKPAPDEILLNDLPEEVHPVKFEAIDEEYVRQAAMKTRGGSGPSGLDADGWRRILISQNFGKSNGDLRKAIARCIKKLCIERCNNQEVSALMASRLLPLDKNPGLRPIGVGEVLRRIIGKVVMTSLREEIISSVGSLQVCAGHEGGCEAAVHAMRTVFQQEDSEAVLLVDAANAFNSVNRNAFLHNIRIICPSLSTFVYNCYSSPTRLFVIGGTEISSSEGTTQGDPAAMAIYAVAIIPMILMLVDTVSNIPNNKMASVAYADDLSAAGRISELKVWWDNLIKLGPKFGYYPQPSKSWLIVKEHQEHQAKATFINTKINITKDGKRHLGAIIGSESFRKEYLSSKITDWIEGIKLLSKIARTDPQSAYACFISGFKHKLNYIMRTVPNTAAYLQQIDEIVQIELIPAITGGITCSEEERKLLSLPPKLGGLGIPIFSTISDAEFENSKHFTASLQKNIIEQNRVYVTDKKKLKQLKNEIKAKRNDKHQNLLKDIRKEMSKEKIRLNDINQEIGASSWLTSLPLKEEGYALSKEEFWDLVRIRYGWFIKRLPINCACGSKFNIQHALVCKKGGFVTLRHNNLRDITAALLKKVCHDVKVEPHLQQLSGELLNERTANKQDDARVDISARGFWQAGQQAFYDVRVFYSNAKRYQNVEIKKCYELNEKEKKRAYNERILNVEQRTFTPIVMSANGGIGREGEKFYGKLASKISEKRCQPYSVVSSWIRRKISFSLMKSICMCLRGRRTLKDFRLINSMSGDAEASEKASVVNDE